MGSSALSPTRRSVLAGVAAVAASGCAMPAAALAAPAKRPSRGVVSFHMDQPLLDPTGRGKPYRPAAGAAVRLPDAVLLHHPYL